MKTSRLALLLLTLSSTYCWADATFTSTQNTLHIPYVRYQAQFYQADFSYLAPDLLRLDNIAAQLEPIQADAITPVYSDLNFHLSRITVADKQYAADMRFVGDNIFQIHNQINYLLYLQYFQYLTYVDI